MLLQFGRGNWLQKFKQQPEAARMVLDKIRRDGLRPALRAVSAKLDAFTPLGYCNAGRVLAVGRGVSGFSAGDRVASNGPHASVVSVPQNLAVRIPDGVPDEDAAFTPLAAIALQGIRLAEVTFGDTAVVIGLGLIGMLAVQLLRAAGCTVLGVDTDEAAVTRAIAVGADAVLSDGASEAWVLTKTGGRGADAVLVATASTEREPVDQAARFARRRGRLVLIGTANLQLDRSAFFRKELSFQVSSSYGPGRYDPAYEVKGQDYPVSYVRWTAGRNFEAVLHAMAAGTLRIAPLIGSRAPLEGYEAVYTPGYPSGGAVVFEYAESAAPDLSNNIKAGTATPATGAAGIIGAGAFAQGVLLPLLQKLSVPLRGIASSGGLSAGLAAKRFGIGNAVNDYRLLIEDPAVDQIFIATRHDSHARLAVEALEAGKHVFVEKPLALTPAELDAVRQAAQSSGKQLTVGFNRRFAPLAMPLKAWAGDGSGLHLIYTVNAGTLPLGHWALDSQAGGGRLIGEGCHFIDFCAHLCGAPVTRVCTTALGSDADSTSMLLRFANGSTAVVHYITGGSAHQAKERLEAHRAGETAVLQAWRRLEIWRARGKKVYRQSQDKGHFGLLKAATDSVRNGTPAPIPIEALFNSSAATLAAAASLQTGTWMDVAHS